MVGISGDVLLWINHPHFVVSRTNRKANLSMLKKKKKKKIKIGNMVGVVMDGSGKRGGK
jgi:hypothetical protein